jgi:serine protease
VLFFALLSLVSPDEYVLARTPTEIRRVKASEVPPNVLWVEPDRLRWPQSVPDDPLYTMQTALQAIHAPDAWATSEGAAEIVVAVLDTGVRPHPDLDARLLPGYDFISDPANAGDGDGRDPDPTDPGTTTAGSSGLHGSHISGIIGADSDNRLGVTGLDWRCRLLPVRVLGVQGGAGRDSDIADAIRWAAGLHVDGVPDNAHPADVINMSFGGEGRSQTLQEAVDAAQAAGALVVAAAGNQAQDARSDSPGGLDGLVSVGAADANGQLAPYSNFGPMVTLLAPGDQVLSTINDGYGYLSGSSQAAAFASGAAALVKSVNRGLDPPRLKALLAAAANPSSRCASPANASSPGCGFGLLDVAAAVNLVASCGSDCPAPPARVEIQGGCSVASHGDRVPAGLTLLVASAICALLRRTRCPRSDSSAKTSR